MGGFALAAYNENPQTCSKPIAEGDGEGEKRWHKLWAEMQPF